MIIRSRRCRSVRDWPTRRTGVRMILLVLLCASVVGTGRAEDEADPFLDKARQDCPGFAKWDEARIAARKARQATEPQTYSQPALRKQLKAMVTADEEARRAAMPFQNEPASLEYKAASKKEIAVDRRNLARLKAIIRQYGFPTLAMVGRDGVNQAWLLVQHAADNEFRGQVLKKLESSAAANEVGRSAIALLTDRVLMFQRKPQRYGGNFVTADDGQHRLWMTEDPAGLDARRAAMDLPSMADYVCVLKSINGGEWSTEPLSEFPKGTPAS